MLVSAIRTYLADFWGRSNAKGGVRRPVEVVFRNSQQQIVRFLCNAVEPTGARLGEYWFDGFAIKVLSSYARDAVNGSSYTWSTLAESDLGTMVQTTTPIPSLPRPNGSSVRPTGGYLNKPLIPMFPRSLWEPALGLHFEGLEKQVEDLEATYAAKEVELGTYKVAQLAIRSVLNDDSLINLQWFEKKRLDLGLRIQSLQQFTEFVDERPQLLAQQIQEVATLLKDLNVNDLVFKNKDVTFSATIHLPVYLAPPTEDSELVTWKWVKEWFAGAGPCLCKDDSQVIIPEPIAGPQAPIIVGVTNNPVELRLQTPQSLAFLSTFEEVANAILTLQLQPTGVNITIDSQTIPSGGNRTLTGTMDALNALLAAATVAGARNDAMAGSLAMVLTNPQGLFDEKVQQWTLVDAQPRVLSISGPAAVNEGDVIRYTVNLNGNWGGELQDPWQTGGTSTPVEDWTGPVFIGASSDSGKMITVPAGSNRFYAEFQTIADEKTEGTETLVFSIGQASATTNILDTSTRPILLIIEMEAPSNVFEDEEFDFVMKLSSNRGGTVEYPLFRTGTAEIPGDLTFVLNPDSGVTWDPATGVVVVPPGVSQFSFLGKVGSDFWTEKDVTVIMTSSAVSKTVHVIYVSEYRPVEVSIDKVSLVGCATVVTLRGVQIGEGQHTYEWEQLMGTPVNWLESTFQLVTSYEENIKRDDKIFRLWVDRGTPFEQYVDTYVTTVGRDPFQGLMDISGTASNVMTLGGLANPSNWVSYKVPEYRPDKPEQWSTRETVRPALIWSDSVVPIGYTVKFLTRNWNGVNTKIPIGVDASYYNMPDDAWYGLNFGPPDLRKTTLTIDIEGQETNNFGLSAMGTPLEAPTGVINEPLNWLLTRTTPGGIVENIVTELREQVVVDVLDPWNSCWPAKPQDLPLEFVPFLEQRVLITYYVDLDPARMLLKDTIVSLPFGFTYKTEGLGVITIG